VSFKVVKDSVYFYTIGIDGKVDNEENEEEDENNNSYGNYGEESEES
jgi:hypothetical protein